MVRLSKVLVWLPILAVVGVVALAYSGVAEPALAPDTIPGGLPHAVGGSIALIVGAAVVSTVLDRWAWRRMGSAAGLSPEGLRFSADPPEGNSELLPKPVLSGASGGRSVRVRTYSTGGGGGQHGGSRQKTFTVVEAELETPVEWTATLGPESETTAPEMPQEFDSTEAVTVDGYGAWGEVSEELARDLLSARVRTALSELEDGVSVGNIGHHMLGEMLDSIPEETDSMGASLAKGMLSMVEPEGADGPSERVTHCSEGLLLDEEELQRRIDAVVAVADEVDRIGTKRR